MAGGGGGWGVPIEVGIWRLGDNLQQVGFSSIESEARLEDTLAKDISILSPKLILIGRAGSDGSPDVRIWREGMS